MRADWLRRRCRHAAKRGFYWRFLPVSDTCRASGTRERDQTGGRSIIASLPSLVISSSSSSPSFVFSFFFCHKKTTRTSSSRFLKEHYGEKHASFFFIFCGNGLLLFGRQNEQRSSGSQTGTVQWKYYLITPFALAALFFFLSSVRRGC